MRVPEQHITWNAPIGSGRTTDTRSWYKSLKAWWANHQDRRQEARLAAMAAYWHAKHEALTPLRADAAAAMAAADHVFATTAIIYGLAQ